MPQTPSIATHSDEVQDIITATPIWLVRWGISIVFFVLLLIGLIANFIQYPDIVATSMTVNSINSPKSVYSKNTGKLITLLVKNGELVKSQQALGFLESTGNANHIMALQENLEVFRNHLLSSEAPSQVKLSPPVNLELGEIQSAYQTFYQSYLSYVTHINDGFMVKKRNFIIKEKLNIQKQKEQILAQKKTQEQTFEISEQQYETAKKLANKGVLSKVELQNSESKLLSQRQPLQQVQSELLNNQVNYQSKEQELLELENTIHQQRSLFLQSLNTMIDAAQQWVQNYVFRSPINGVVQFAGIIQENQTLNAGQQVFIINPGNTDFFGVVKIPQYNLGKVSNGQSVLVKFQSYPFEEFGIVRGKLEEMNDAPVNDSVFVAKVSLVNQSINSKIKLKNGMLANAEIITQESTLLQRFYRNIIKMMNQR